MMWDSTYTVCPLLILLTCSRGDINPEKLDISKLPRKNKDAANMVTVITASVCVCVCVCQR